MLGVKLLLIKIELSMTSAFRVNSQLSNSFLIHVQYVRPSLPIVPLGMDIYVPDQLPQPLCGFLGLAVLKTSNTSIYPSLHQHHSFIM